MSKHKPQGFQLKPKHLVMAVLGVCIAAIVALVIGVVGTFKPRDQVRTPAGQEPYQQNADRVEVWKPEGADTQGAVILNPDVLPGQRNPQHPPAGNEAQEQTERNPFLPPASSEREAHHGRAEEGDDNRRPRVKPLDNDRLQNRQEPDRPMRPAENPAAPAVSVQPQPTPDPKPEPRPEPKPEPKPAPVPQTRPQQKEVIDNLF